MMTPKTTVWRRAALALALLLTLSFSGCVASDAIVELPAPTGLPDLAQLENHLDYVDPDDGQSTYVRTEGGR